ncbi:hypothetical protein NDU88_002099 [Pleurodeles waltl]|uniref:Uncharacterized protein n=1 Tax=Pleurodeles waltl TaxID=8319 RepID=A0AAV7RBS1_PLEWA|nr:hypothetical protein NDU88_002099 [Pleurodeles waltl]
MLGGGADTPRQHPRRALCVARIDAQSWASGLARAKRTALGRRKGPPRALRPPTRGDKYRQERGPRKSTHRGILQYAVQWCGEGLNVEKDLVDDWAGVDDLPGYLMKGTPATLFWYARLQRYGNGRI